MIVLIAGCSGKKNIPDVSNIAIKLDVVRFEKDFFAMDTTHLDASLETLFHQYPGFAKDFFYRVMGANANPDTAMKEVRQFIRMYKTVYDSSAKIFADFNPVEKEIKKGLRFVKYYFPSYKLPEKLFTFVGPVDAVFKTANGVSGDVITRDGLGIGLQLHLGKDFSLYQTGSVQQLYPSFVSRKFEAPYIPVNCIKNIIDDIYPDNSSGRPLVEQMIESGKRLYMLDALLPETADSIKTGYTQKQLDDCYHNETAIWSYFAQNDLLYSEDPSQTGMYMNDGPGTPELGTAAPGFIGQFVGWQIVKKWMSKNEKKTLDELMKMPAKQLFEEAKYKPR